ncbi:hypothetical protein JCM18750_12570 [Halostagnicola bangensis]
MRNLEGLESFVDETMQTSLEEHDIVGASVAVVHDDELVLAEGYGDVSVDGPAVGAAETRFLVGSVSKPIVWTAVMQLIEADRIDPNEAITTYLESVSVPETEWDPITMAHLATHTAGFEQRYGGTWVRDPDDLRSLPTVLNEEQPERVRPPGTVASYSNYGTALAAQVVADVTGTPFEEYVEENIFEPAGMDTSTFEQPVPEESDTSLATGYTTLGGTPQETRELSLELAPAGSMATTATGMGAFMRAHLGGGMADGERILEEETVDAMHERWFTHHEKLDGIAFGLFERSRGTAGDSGNEDDSSGGQSRLLEHDGQIPGSFHSRLLLAPEHDLGLFLVYNTDSATGASADFVDAFLEEYLPLEESSEIEAVEPDGRPERADELEGSYRGVNVAESESAKFWSVVQAGSIDVSVDDDGALVTDLGGETRWIEREPLLFRKKTATNSWPSGRTTARLDTSSSAFTRSSGDRGTNRPPHTLASRARRRSGCSPEPSAGRSLEAGAGFAVTASRTTIAHRNNAFRRKRQPRASATLRATTNRVPRRVQIPSSNPADNRMRAGRPPGERLRWKPLGSRAVANGTSRPVL